MHLEVQLSRPAAHDDETQLLLNSPTNTSALLGRLSTANMMETLRLERMACHSVVALGAQSSNPETVLCFGAVSVEWYFGFWGSRTCSHTKPGVEALRHLAREDLRTDFDHGLSLKLLSSQIRSPESSVLRRSSEEGTGVKPNVVSYTEAIKAGWVACLYTYTLYI